MKKSLTNNSIIVASQHQVSANLSTDDAGDIVILDINKGIYYELYGVGVRFWELIQQPRTIQAIIDTLLDEYEVNAERCQIDIFVLTEDLAKHGLIEIN